VAFARFEKKASIFTAKSRVADGPCMVGMYAKSLARAWSGLDPVVAFRGVRRAPDPSM
jgi:hypothetical protein